MDEWEENVNTQIYEELPERIYELEQRLEKVEKRVANLEGETPDQQKEFIPGDNEHGKSTGENKENPY